MSYRTDNERVYKPGARTEIEVHSGGYYLVQRHDDSPHNEVWRSEPYPTADSARRRYVELHAQDYINEHRDPIEACSNLSHIAFIIHMDSASHIVGDRGALINCRACYKKALDLVEAACEELQWVAEARKLYAEKLSG